MSRSAAKSVVEDYSISPSKVHIIPGGANLDENSLPTTAQPLNSIPLLTPLRLGFIGKDWQRKGLPYVLKVAEVLHKRGIAVEIVAIGPSNQELPAHPLVKSLGFIDKSKDLHRFVELVRSFHFGCLFSCAEAFGISNRECLRLGVPVLATRVGGIPDTVPEGLGFLFDPGSPPEAIADLLESFVHDPSKYHSLRQRVVASAQEFSWQKTVSNFIELWQGSEEFRYDAIAAS
jgi:glycosyltransferase involved in cell wall biosynthesis